jgi:hypothetical protein
VTGASERLAGAVAAAAFTLVSASHGAAALKLNAAPDDDASF